MRERPRGHYIDEAEALARMVRRHGERFSAPHRAAAESILFWSALNPLIIRIDPNIGEAVAQIRDAAERMEMLA